VSVAFKLFQFVEPQKVSREDANIPIDSLRLLTIDKIFALFLLPFSGNYMQYLYL